MTVRDITLTRRTLLTGFAVAATLVACKEPAPRGLHALETPPAVAALELPDDTAAAEPTQSEAPAPAEPSTWEVGTRTAPTREMPPPRTVEPAASGFPVGDRGGNIVAGELIIEVPANALGPGTAIEARLLTSVDELTHPVPPGLILGVADVSSWNPGLTASATVQMPLSYTLEPGTEVELLAWHPNMRSFLAIAQARVDASGTFARFPVRQFGEMVVRAVPEQRQDSACQEEAPAYERAWPSQNEDHVSGLTPVEDRIPRERAFSVLTDFRLSPLLDWVDFKNEEAVRDSPATRANELDHQDEDYLMDPTAAAALAALVRELDGEWFDPYTGESSYRVRVTEAYDSLIEHSRQSTHYQGRAIDLTLTPVPLPARAERRAKYGRLSALSICAGFDYVLFENQYHVHASVRPSQVALAFRDDEGRRLETARIYDPDYRYAFGEIPEELPEVAAITWPEGGRVELLGPTAGRGFAVEGGQSSRIASATVRDPDSAERSVSNDGLRQVVVIEGQAYLSYVGDRVPPGSVNADGEAVPVVYPLPVSEPDEHVEGVSLLHHRRTLEALRP